MIRQHSKQMRCYLFFHFYSNTRLEGNQSWCPLNGFCGNLENAYLIPSVLSVVSPIFTHWESFCHCIFILFVFSCFTDAFVFFFIFKILLVLCFNFTFDADSDLSRYLPTIVVSCAFCTSLGFIYSWTPSPSSSASWPRIEQDQEDAQKDVNPK